MKEEEEQNSRLHRPSESFGDDSRGDKRENVATTGKPGDQKARGRNKEEMYTWVD